MSTGVLAQWLTITNSKMVTALHTNTHRHVALKFVKICFCLILVLILMLVLVLVLVICCCSAAIKHVPTGSKECPPMILQSSATI